MQPTNPNQFTEKAWEAIARTPDIVKQAQQQHIETEHLLKALTEQDGLATSIFSKCDVPIQRVRERTEEFIAKQPKVSGG
ncbi:MAG: Clp protease N-terminal domain-containing protein, partial [Synechococcales cyanobacterium]